MIKSMFDSPISFGILEQAVTNVMKAAAIEATALSNILNLENEIIQKAKYVSANLEEFVAINESVNSVIKNIIQIQMMSQEKLQFIAALLYKIENVDENEVQEE